MIYVVDVPTDDEAPTLAVAFTDEDYEIVKKAFAPVTQALEEFNGTGN